MKILKLCLISLILAFPALPANGHATTCGGDPIAPPVFHKDDSLPTASETLFVVAHAAGSVGVATLVMEGPGKLIVWEFDHDRCLSGEVKCSLHAPVAACQLVPTEEKPDHQISVRCNSLTTPCAYKLTVVFS